MESMLGLFRRWTKTRSDRGIELRPRDCHSHVIPGVDDGSRSMEESLAMLRLLHEAGVRHVIATSHIYPGRFDNEPGPLREAFAELERARAAAGIDLSLELGAEHYLDATLPDRIRRGDIIAFGPERYVLFETHTGASVPSVLWDVVDALTEGGFTPLMAHVERYQYLRSEEGHELCEDLRSAGVRFQVNRTVGKTNVPGQGTRGRFLSKLIERGWIDEVGSDLHRPTQDGRPYQLDENIAAA